MKIISINRGQCMNKLNKKTELTEKTIHLMVTSLCERDCRYIKRIYVYTNASELADWIIKYNRMHSNIGSQIDGLNISLKTPEMLRLFKV